MNKITQKWTCHFTRSRCLGRGRSSMRCRCGNMGERRPAWRRVGVQDHTRGVTPRADIRRLPGRERSRHWGASTWGMWPCSPGRRSHRARSPRRGYQGRYQLLGVKMGLLQSHLPENFEDLVDLRVTREQRLASAHLGEDSTHGPHINASRVLASTKQNLWGAVPKSDDLKIY